MAAILGMGNPLLDISATVKKEFLTKYNLKANDAILYDEEDIFEDLNKQYKDQLEYQPGGATQNSMRVVQWILNEPFKTAFFGCVGKDENAKKLEKCAKESGVDVKYQIRDDIPTGKCACLITGQERSLVSKLDAANKFTIDHLEPNWSVVEKAKIYYSAGYFLTVSPDTMVKVAKHAVENDKIFSMNLSAPFLSSFFMDPLQQVLKYSSLLFGNESEALEFGKKQGYNTTDIKEIAEKISQIPLEAKNDNQKRTVIITQGAGPVIVVQNGETKLFEVEHLTDEQIVDTNGAGDAFVGGYLAQLALGKDLDTCVRCGIYAATTIIGMSGCTVPDKMEFK